eukprot:1161419-Pelagomonas_calceolata.AAC.8
MAVQGASDTVAAAMYACRVSLPVLHKCFDWLPCVWPQTEGIVLLQGYKSRCCVIRSQSGHPGVQDYRLGV